MAYKKIVDLNDLGRFQNMERFRKCPLHITGGALDCDKAALGCIYCKEAIL